MYDKIILKDGTEVDLRDGLYHEGLEDVSPGEALYETNEKGKWVLFHKDAGAPRILSSKAAREWLFKNKDPKEHVFEDLLGPSYWARLVEQTYQADTE